MKTMMSVMALLVIGVAVGVGPASAAELKIGVVDMARIVKAHPETASADSLLGKQVDEYEAEQKDLMDDYDKLKKAFEDARKDASDKALSEEAREGKMKIAEERLAAIREHELKVRETTMKSQKQLNDQKMRMQKRIVGKIRDTLAEYAGKNGITLVLDSAGMSVNGAEIVLFSAEKLDITDDILKLVVKDKPVDLKAGDAEGDKPAKDTTKTEPKKAMDAK